ncbi:MAG TPA: glycosyltransferase family 4 protein [Candidatus Gastranaerophilales bacterium]|nr:glycosyltransferase family 4 protein [Candidatus Gastranaerophilales bacterium]
MNILFLNTRDGNGGAAIAAYRLLEGIKNLTGSQIKMLVNNKSTTPYYVEGPETDFKKLKALFRNPAEKLALIPYTQREKVIFSSSIVPNYDLFNKIKNINPDILHLHWINSGFLRLEQLLKIKAPIAWTLHDMWAFTGGCHCAGKCLKYLEECNNCPVLNSNNYRDLAYRNFKNKEKIFKNLDLTIICPSSWLSENAKKSKLLKNINTITIPNGLDINIFKPSEKKVARNILNLPQDKKLLLFGAFNCLIDKNKGLNHLINALTFFKNEEFELVIFGANKPENPLGFDLKTHYMGILKDEITMALLYSACDATIAPSIQESFGQTASESLACATPVIAFEATGLLDIVDHKTSGYLAKPYEAADLAQGIKWALSLSNDEYKIISTNARKKAEENFDIKLVSQKYYDLYKTLNIHL